MKRESLKGKNVLLLPNAKTTDLSDNDNLLTSAAYLLLYKDCFKLEYIENWLLFLEETNIIKFIDQIPPYNPDRIEIIEEI